jgi:addiction module RelE/StbE family toxin
MHPDYHKRFKKQFKKMPQKIRERFIERLQVFKNNPMAFELHNHALHGEYHGYRSINVTGDLRAVYEIREMEIKFLFIDTHSNLYS